MENIVKELIKRNKTISTMESCTGGYLANEITNIDDASKVLKFSAVTYSNEFKIKMGVDANVIEKYSVYSMETAHEMAKNISKFTDSDYGVGITGKLKRIDHSNVGQGNDNEVFVSVFEKETGKYYDKNIRVYLETRRKNKEYVSNEIKELLNQILK